MAVFIYLNQLKTILLNWKTQLTKSMERDNTLNQVFWLVINSKTFSEVKFHLLVSMTLIYLLYLVLKEVNVYSQDLRKWLGKPLI